MPVSGMNHCTILTADLPATTAFYAEILGLREGPRPAFGFPGAWLYAGTEPVLHVVAGRAASELRAGVIDHVAFTASGLGATLAKLAARGIPHGCRQLPGLGTWQLFFHDPNGAKVELDFAADESPAVG